MRLRTVVAGALAALSFLTGTAASADPAAPPEEILDSYPWPDALKDTLTDPAFAAHAILVDAPADAVGKVTGKVLRVSASKTEPLRLRLLTVPNPPVTADFYAVAGQVKYEDVEGSGYLEMWNTFPAAAPGGQERSFFSRTLGEMAGDPMESFRGTSAWRPVILPFNAAGAGARPTGLTINLVLPVGGTVYLAPMHLAQYHYGSGQPGSAPGTNGPWRPGWKEPLAAAAVFLAVAAGLAAWRGSRRRRAAEWRRMAAHDASTR